MQFQLKSGHMFDTDNPACPNCGGEMWDNRNNKKTPKSPDFRCKNNECKDASGYPTGVYIPKPKGQAPAQKPAAKPAPAQAQRPAARPAATPAPAPRPAGGKGDYGNSVPPSMYGAWAMNLVVALVGQGKVTNVAEGIVAYKEALKGVGEAIEANKMALDAKLPASERQVPVTPAAKPAVAPAKPAPAAVKPAPAQPAPAAAPVQEAQPVAPEDIQYDPGAETPAVAEEAVADPLDAVAGGIDEISMEDLSNVDI